MKTLTLFLFSFSLFSQEPIVNGSFYETPSFYSQLTGIKQTYYMVTVFSQNPNVAEIEVSLKVGDLVQVARQKVGEPFFFFTLPPGTAKITRTIREFTVSSVSVKDEIK